MEFKFDSETYVKGKGIWAFLKVICYILTIVIALILIVFAIEGDFKFKQLAYLVAAVGFSLGAKSRAEEHTALSVIDLVLDDHEMHWSFPQLDRRYNKNLYTVAYRDITDLEFNAETNYLFITGEIEQTKTDSEKSPKTLKNFCFYIKKKFVTEVTEAISERCGRIVKVLNPTDDFEDEDGREDE